MKLFVKFQLKAVLCLGYILYFRPTLFADEYWVFFKDKGKSENLEQDLIALTAEWPARSLSRRRLEGRGLSLADLDVNAEYISIIESICGVPRVQSRWLNAASFAIKDSQLHQINKLPFVKEILQVARMAVDRFENEFDDIHTEPRSVGTGWYGPSWFQAFQIHATEAHQRGLTGEGVLLGAMDTGFEFTHRCFTGMDLAAEWDFIFNDADPSYDPRTDPLRQANHGTACLSTIVGFDPGYLIGIAPRASVAVAKTEMTGSERAIEEDWWVAGLEWLEWLGADVVTSSLTYREWYSKTEMDGLTSPASRAAQRAVELGMVICISAGNSGPEAITIGAPADAYGVLAVAAVDTTGRPTRFSSRGPSADGRVKPDVAALGLGVVCAAPMTWSGYDRWNGTSLACPLVAGSALLVREAHPDWTAAQVIEAIRMTASQADKADFEIGFGIVNTAAALEYPSISGRVLLKSHHSPVGGGVVILNGENFYREAAIATGGWFSFPNLPRGEYAVSVKTDKGVFQLISSVKLPPSLPLDILIASPEAQDSSDSSER